MSSCRRLLDGMNGPSARFPRSGESSLVPQSFCAGDRRDLNVRILGYCFRKGAKALYKQLRTGALCTIGPIPDKPRYQVFGFKKKYHWFAIPYDIIRLSGYFYGKGTDIQR